MFRSSRSPQLGNTTAVNVVNIKIGDYNMPRVKYDLQSTDVCRAVAQQSSLTAKQVQECFKALHDIIEQIADSPNRFEDFIMPLPYLGTIKFQRKYGDPTKEITGSIKYVDLSKAHPKEQYDAVSIRVNEGLRRRVRDISYQRFLMQKEKRSLGKKEDRQEN